MFINWNSSIFWGIVGIVAGMVINYFCQRFPVNKKKIIFKSETSCLISNETTATNGLEVTYNNIAIDNLYLTRITINNRGVTNILESDFIPNHPLSIVTTGQIFCEHLVDDPAFNSNDITLEQIQNNGKTDCLIINIKLLYKKSSFSFHIMHSGELLFDGILNDGKILEYTKHEYRKPLFKGVLILNIFSSFIILAIISETFPNIGVFLLCLSLMLYLIYSIFFDKNS